MAGPVAHIVCALSLLQAGALEVADACKYLVGTSFNDIRYLAHIDRRITHDSQMTWEKVVQENNPFKKGMLVHALLDEVRQQELEKKLELLVGYMPYKSHLLKLHEDRLLYHWFSKKWPLFRHCFDTIIPEERQFGIADQTIACWHRIVKDYLSRPPSTKFLKDMVSKVYKNSPFIHSSSWANYYLRKLTRNKKVNNEIRAFYSDIVSHMIVYSPLVQIPHEDTDTQIAYIQRDSIGNYNGYVRGKRRAAHVAL